MPFTVEQFYAVFAAYNHAVWPAQYALFVLAGATVYCAALPSRTYDRVASGALAFLWLWMALAYHAAFFWRINLAAPLFALGFLLQAAILWRIGVTRARLTLELRNDAAGWLGSLAVLYALAVYPLLSILYGHNFPQMPTFGLPCPTTIFTMGLLLWARPAVPRVLLAIPVLWSLVGTVTALQLGMPPDFGLTATAAAALGIAFAQWHPHARLA